MPYTHDGEFVRYDAQELQSMTTRQKIRELLDDPATAQALGASFRTALNVIIGITDFIPGETQICSIAANSVKTIARMHPSLHALDPCPDVALWMSGGCVVMKAEVLDVPVIPSYAVFELPIQLGADIPRIRHGITVFKQYFPPSLTDSEPSTSLEPFTIDPSIDLSIFQIDLHTPPDQPLE
jgi:hypothetical protein